MKFALMLVVVFVFVPSVVIADSTVPPRSYTTTSPNGQYVFVMIAPLSPEEDAANYEGAYAARIREIRRMYTVSGLYRNDGSTTPLWTVGWYALNVEVASDGKHVVRVGPSAAVSTNDEAVAFFANDRLLHSYRITDLVVLPWLMPRSVSHFRWRADAHFDDTSMTYTIQTNHREHIVFDVRTGAIIQASRPVHSMSGVSVISIAVLVLLVLRGLRRARRGRHY